MHVVFGQCWNQYISLKKNKMFHYVIQTMGSNEQSPAPASWCGCNRCIWKKIILFFSCDTYILSKPHILQIWSTEYHQWDETATAATLGLHKVGTLTWIGKELMKSYSFLMNYWLLNKSERGDINFFSVVYLLGTPTSSKTYFQPCGQALVKPRGSQNKGTNVGKDL